jgi:hypothetical protein
MFALVKRHAGMAHGQGAMWVRARCLATGGEGNENAGKAARAQLSPE